MYSQTVAMLEKFDNQHDFERMCADILFALGYRDVELIAPRGGSDRGKDIVFTTESGGKGLACVTLRGDIEKKFFEDFSKRQPGEFEKYLFFCTSYLIAQQKLKFAQHVVNTLQAELVTTPEHAPVIVATLGDLKKNKQIADENGWEMYANDLGDQIKGMETVLAEFSLPDDRRPRNRGGMK